MPVRTVTLTHCTPVQLKPRPATGTPSPKILNVTGTATSGSAGTVDVTNGGHQTVQSDSVPPNGALDDSFAVDVSQPRMVHFKAAAGDTIEITYSYE